MLQHHCAQYDTVRSKTVCSLEWCALSWVIKEIWDY